jgi:hypothetical protein
VCGLMFQKCENRFNSMYNAHHDDVKCANKSCVCCGLSSSTFCGYYKFKFICRHIHKSKPYKIWSRGNGSHHQQDQQLTIHTHTHQQHKCLRVRFQIIIRNFNHTRSWYDDDDCFETKE